MSENIGDVDKSVEELLLDFACADDGDTPKVTFVDSHCHLNHERFAGEVVQVFRRARNEDVKYIVVVGYDIPSSEHAMRLAEQDPGIYAAVAVHPHDSKDYEKGAEARLRELAAHPRVVAIGEIGLDYHYDFSPREAQMTAFRAQLSLARETHLPVIIHCREAYTDTLDVLEAEGAAKIGGVMHCWAGTQDEAERTLSLGFYLGIGGVLTFKNAGTLRDVAVSAPMERLLLETDAPYLSPVPHRGKRNEPAYVRLVAEKLAELRNVPVEEVAQVTTANAFRLFHRMMYPI